ncbi:MAG TPA: hypothetical protein VE074_13940 [Jatrophihabitantaceae bacterium]|nr:hypothetical protein [Jatrophihabitantaceae bacterium]
MADGAPQIWDVPITPAQRWALLQLAFSNDAPKVTDAAGGKKLRRALRAFALMTIRDALRAHDNKLSTAQAESSAPALHKITAENLECALGWAAVPRHPAIEIDAGEIFDLLEGIKTTPTYTPPDGVPVFVGSSEDWAPPESDPLEVTCPSCQQKFSLEESSPQR